MRLLKNQIKASGESARKWISAAMKKRARTEWPADVLAVLGSWKESDFPDAKQIRKGYGPDARREKF